MCGPLSVCIASDRHDRRGRLSALVAEGGQEREPAADSDRKPHGGQSRYLDKLSSVLHTAWGVSLVSFGQGGHCGRTGKGALLFSAFPHLGWQGADLFAGRGKLFSTLMRERLLLSVRTRPVLRRLITSCYSGRGVSISLARRPSTQRATKMRARAWRVLASVPAKCLRQFHWVD